MSNSSVKKLSYNVPLWHKPNLSIEEASIYSNIGTGKLYEMTEKQDCFLQPLITKKCRMSSKKLQREIPHFCMCLQRSFYAGEISLQTYFCF